MQSKKKNTEKDPITPYPVSPNGDILQNYSMISQTRYRHSCSPLTLFRFSQVTCSSVYACIVYVCMRIHVTMWVLFVCMCGSMHFRHIYSFMYPTPVKILNNFIPDMIPYVALL